MTSLPASGAIEVLERMRDAAIVQCAGDMSSVYAVDAVHEFPFTRPGFPSRIEGRDAIVSVITAFWSTDQQPQVPVGEHLLATDHVSVPGIKPGADHGVALSQLRTGQGDAPCVERCDGQQLTGHASHPSGHSGPGRGAHRPGR